VPEIWPTQSQELLLLRACFSPRHQALKAYRDWDRLEGLDRIRPQAYPFLALQRRNVSHGPEKRQAEILEGTYRKTWYEKSSCTATTAKLLNCLPSVGIDTVHLEGLPLAGRYYGDLGVRRLRSLRLLVRRANAERVMKLPAGSKRLAQPSPLCSSRSVLSLTLPSSLRRMLRDVPCSRTPPPRFRLTPCSSEYCGSHRVSGMAERRAK
jgi:hypothetical protein